MNTVQPQYWQDFISQNNILYTEISIPEENDLSEVGTDLEIFDEKTTSEEASLFYPGLVVIKDGYIPIAGCSIGSGDPYFININEGENGSLYRIYHDSVFEDGYNVNDAVDKVLENYEDLLKYKNN
jgi:hypothetical protein